MSDVVLMGLINLGLIGYILHLRYKYGFLVNVMHRVFKEVYEGKAEIVKLDEIYVPKAVKE